jgi:DNA-binding PadR family transcriptional regulator
MNLSRLLVLADLSRHGARHGHAIRRDAEQSNVSAWGGVSLGAIYRELRELEAEALVQALRTETEGRRPARTIYQITDEGERELGILREHALTQLRQGPDAVAVALLFGGTDTQGVVLRLLGARRDALRQELEGIAGERAYHVEHGRLGAVGVAVFRRAEHLRAAEIAWIDETLAALAPKPDKRPARKKR